MPPFLFKSSTRMATASRSAMPYWAAALVRLHSDPILIGAFSCADVAPHNRMVEIPSIQENSFRLPLLLLARFTFAPFVLSLMSCSQEPRLVHVLCRGVVQKSVWLS